MEQVFPVGRWLDEVTETLDGPTREAIQKGWETGALRIQHSGIFDAENPDVQDVLRQINEKARNIPRTTRSRINDVITEGYAEGLGRDEIAENIRTLYDGGDGVEGMTKARSEAIAQTAGNAGFERGQLAAWRDAGMTGKSWLTQRDGRQSEGHNAAMGQERELNEAFEVRRTFDKPMETLQHPGDPDASASNLVRCRCSMLPRRDEGE